MPIDADDRQLDQLLIYGKSADALINGLARAQKKKQWQAYAESEERRLQLLPDSEPHSWNELTIKRARCTRWG